MFEFDDNNKLIKVHGFTKDEYKNMNKAKRVHHFNKAMGDYTISPVERIKIYKFIFEHDDYDDVPDAVSSLIETLANRKKQYGELEPLCNIVQGLEGVLKDNYKDYECLPSVHKEIIHMIFHKIARLVNGNNYHIDTAHDITGYAKLLEDYIREQNKC